MKRKKIRILLLLLQIMIFSNIPLSAFAYSTLDNQSNISLTSAHIVWRYKVVGKKIYKRKFDMTNNKWIGKWIPANK